MYDDDKHDSLTMNNRRLPCLLSSVFWFCTCLLDLESYLGIPFVLDFFKPSNIFPGYYWECENHSLA